MTSVQNGTDSILVGSHPWHDLFSIDFYSLPQSKEELTASLNRDGWAVVNNPDPADRLHLRAAPDTGAESLGKFYNRTPVQVLERRDGWSHVRIGLDGRLEGWMMTRFLAFGNDMDAVDSASPDLTLRDGKENHLLYSAPRPAGNDGRTLQLQYVDRRRSRGRTVYSAGFGRQHGLSAAKLAFRGKWLMNARQTPNKARTGCTLLSACPVNLPTPVR